MRKFNLHSGLSILTLVAAIGLILVLILSISISAGAQTPSPSATASPSSFLGTQPMIQSISAQLASGTATPAAAASAASPSPSASPVASPAAVPDQGQIQFVMDHESSPQGVSGTGIQTGDTTYTWTGVPSGQYVFEAELVDPDGNLIEAPFDVEIEFSVILP
jgi:hypothetical protein